jgi:hypothetical protein
VTRSPFVVYAHGQIRQGYTHRGRPLGPAIGPNANSQFLGVDLFTPSGRRGIFLERVRYNVDANRDQWNRLHGAEAADLELNAGIDHHLFLDRFDLGWALTHSYRRNRNWIALLSEAPAFQSEHNWNLRIDLAWKPRTRAPLSARREQPPVTGGER